MDSIEERLKAELKRFTIADMVDNPDPDKRPFIELTSADGGKTKIYLHYIAKATLYSPKSKKSTTIKIGATKIKVKETPLQVVYLLRCKVGMCLFNEVVMAMIRKVPESLSYEQVREYSGENGNPFTL